MYRLWEESTFQRLWWQETAAVSARSAAVVQQVMPILVLLQKT